MAPELMCSIGVGILVETEGVYARLSGAGVVKPLDGKHLAAVREAAVVPLIKLGNQGVRIFDEIIEATVAEYDVSGDLFLRLRPPAPPKMPPDLLPARVEAQVQSSERFAFLEQRASSFAVRIETWIPLSAT
ncbi:hypothetical protein AB0C07_17995 [Actinoplanes missouriensis]|uniref:hypothetical protein n=1 Tax=Actinoplanes missouriensis TaxID=1866 RepID=UPI0033E23493